MAGPGNDEHSEFRLDGTGIAEMLGWWQPAEGLAAI
jgi:hypothetical protein